MEDQSATPQVDPDFSAGPFVTGRASATEELSSLLGSLYITEDVNAPEAGGSVEDGDNPPPEAGSQSDGEVQDLLQEEEGVQEEGGVPQPELVVLQNRVSVVEEKLRTFKVDLRDSITSSLNRERGFREYVKGCLEKVEQGFLVELAKVEQSMVGCLKRRDEMWKREIVALRPTSTPIGQKTTVPTTVLGSRPLPTDTFTMPGVSPFYSKPPVRLELPTFGPSWQSAEVLGFVEQVENFLELRPLTNPELMGALSTVLKGPALSWCKAAKHRVKDWTSFKEAFMFAFLPSDYMAEVEEKLRDLVQQLRLF